MQLYNTLTKKKEKFVPIRDKQVSIYSCGPTVNNDLHIGSARFFVVVDLLKRFLLYKGFDVKHVMNITDIDDKTIKAGGTNLRDYTNKYEKRFYKDLEALNILPADIYPRATENIQEMIELTKSLEKQGYAYERCHSVYFNISRFKGYGGLSGIDPNSLKDGVRVDTDDYAKDNPRDFAILKRSTLTELKKGVYYKTEYGNIRPGWHIECAAIAKKYLGDHIDIHMGGTDLVFPHHENEKAIIESLTENNFVNYWVHCEHLVYNGKKITAENIKTIRDLMQNYSPLSIRYYLLSKNYRLSFNFTNDGLKHSVNELDKLQNSVDLVTGYVPLSESNFEFEFMDLHRQKIEHALDDNLDIHKALKELTFFMKKLNRFTKRYGLSAEQKRVIEDFIVSINSIFGVFSIDNTIPENIKLLAKKREQARSEKDWKKADRIRDTLISRGYDVIDLDSGFSIKRIKKK